MEDLLFDRETLGQFVDELMKKHPLPLRSAEELSSFREQQIKSLDDFITKAIFTSLNEEQDAEMQTLLDQETDDPDIFRDFFQKHNLDIEKMITDAISAYDMEFLKGGQNA